MVLFTVIFGRMVGVESNGVPYALFSFAALVPWTYFANSLSEATNSLISNANMISKVYFPRVILPLSAVASKLVDFAIAMAMLAILMAFHGAVPGPGVIVLPVLVLLMVAGVGRPGDVADGHRRPVPRRLLRDVVHHPGADVRLPRRLPGQPRPGAVPPALRPEPDGRRHRGLPLGPAGHHADALGPHRRRRPRPRRPSPSSGMLYFRRMEQYFADVA